MHAMLLVVLLPTWRGDVSPLSVEWRGRRVAGRVGGDRRPHARWLGGGRVCFPRQETVYVPCLLYCAIVMFLFSCFTRPVSKQYIKN